MIIILPSSLYWTPWLSRHCIRHFRIAHNYTSPLSTLSNMASLSFMTSQRLVFLFQYLWSFECLELMTKCLRNELQQFAWLCEMYKHVLPRVQINYGYFCTQQFHYLLFIFYSFSHLICCCQFAWVENSFRMLGHVIHSSLIIPGPTCLTSLFHPLAYCWWNNVPFSLFPFFHTHCSVPSWHEFFFCIEISGEIQK